MKKLFSALLIIFTLFLIGSCKKALKDEQDYFVVVKTVSATVQSDGSVLVQAEIESPGHSPGSSAANAGFCMSTSNLPKMLDRQKLASINGTHFSATYPAGTFSIDSTYYFRSFATNSYGYSYGTIVSLDSISAAPVTAPCSIPANSFNFGDGNGTYTYNYVGAQDSTTNYFDGANASTTINYRFGSPLITGIFRTTTDYYPNPGFVFIGFSYGFSMASLDQNEDVYVNRLSPTSYDVRICDATWSYSGTTMHFKTRFITTQ